MEMYIKMNPRIMLMYGAMFIFDLALAIRNRDHFWAYLGKASLVNMVIVLMEAYTR